MPVKAGDVLFELATRELNLERAGILADIAQYAREAEKRRTANQLPEMLIAEAQANQAGARLKQIDYRLSIAQATSPINGVLVEGEPGKNLGGAVRRGDTIVKVAAIHGLYVEAAVDERDVGRVEAEKSVRFTLLADTGKTYSMKVVRVVPAASVKEGANTFPVRIEMQGLPPEWWRPGMSGVSKIYVGWRPLLWIASHRMLDYLKLLLWF
jgi:multidrug resistance efflux pump